MPHLTRKKTFVHRRNALHHLHEHPEDFLMVGETRRNLQFDENTCWKNSKKCQSVSIWFNKFNPKVNPKEVGKWKSQKLESHPIPSNPKNQNPKNPCHDFPSTPGVGSDFLSLLLCPLEEVVLPVLLGHLEFGQGLRLREVAAQNADVGEVLEHPSHRQVGVTSKTHGKHMENQWKIMENNGKQSNCNKRSRKNEKETTFTLWQKQT